MNGSSSNHPGRATAAVVGLIIVLTVLAVGAIHFTAASGKVAQAAAEGAVSGSAKHPVSASQPGAQKIPKAVSPTADPALSIHGSPRHQSAAATPTAAPTTPITSSTPVPSSSSPSPRPTGTHASSAPRTEREWRTGANTFSDPDNASGMGPKIAPGAYVLVSCKLYDPSIVSTNPGGYWYRIASSPWGNRYYAVANTFLNGDPWAGPYTHPTDLTVPNC